MNDWQPIETAPKIEDQKILAFCPTGRHNIVVACWYFDEWNFSPSSEDYATLYPTHWMPLPEPPK